VIGLIHLELIIAENCCLQRASGNQPENLKKFSDKPDFKGNISTPGDVLVGMCRESFFDW